MDGGFLLLRTLTEKELINLCIGIRLAEFRWDGSALEIGAFIKNHFPETRIPDSRFLLLEARDRGGLESLVNDKLNSGWQLHGSPIIESNC